MECQICYEIFDFKTYVPKILVKCGHSFCKICMERVSNQNPLIQCPICREPTKANKKENLPTNWGLCEMINKTQEFDSKKTLLEKYGCFDDEDYKNIQETIHRNTEPKKLILKKIVNKDFIYVEEFENGQNVSIFNSMSKRNRRYNFNRNSIFANFFNEYSSFIWVYRKASRCRHSHSCLEHNLRKSLFFISLGVLAKYPLEYVLKFIYSKFSNSDSEDKIKKITWIIQWIIGGMGPSIKFMKCMLSFYIDELLKRKIY
jgi:hypothetical protein